MNRVCAQCDAELPENAPGSRCPACLLEIALIGTGEELSSWASESPARQIGDYELLGEVGRGGMGVVFRARQCRLNRTVALKLILSGQLASEEEVRRFRAEAEHAAQLHHPNIVAIYETGEAGGQHYFSMEFVDGRDLAAMVRDGPLPARETARYVQIIALAIHYAHAQGILHRDLKPSNVLIDATGQPRITDFGLAKRLQNDFGITVTGQVLGSPAFMPPELTSGQRGEVGPACDVYGIGGILYHLLTGRPPFQSSALEDLLRQVHEQEPVAPRLLNASVPRDLETICLKCLEKEPSRRYQSAQDLAEDINRHLRDEPIMARPAGRAEKLWRWGRRKPALASLSAALLIVIGVSLAAVLWQWNRATDSAHQLRERVYASDMNLAARAWAEKDLGRARQLLRAHEPRSGETDLRGFEWGYLWEGCQGMENDSVVAHSAEGLCLAVASSGDWLVTGSFDRTLKLWDLPSRRFRSLLTTLATRDPSLKVTASPDGRWLAAGDSTHLQIWETAGWTQTKAIEAGGVPLTFLADGRTLVCAGGNPAQAALRVWDVATWEMQVRATNCQHFAASQDGNWLALAIGHPDSFHLGIELWNGAWQTQGLLLQSEKLLTKVYGMAFSPDGRVLAAGDMAGTVAVWDTSTRELLTHFQAHPRFALALRFSPDGRWLATGSGTDQTIALWNSQTWEKDKELIGHENGIWGLEWTPDGRELISISRDHTVKFWSPSVSTPADSRLPAQDIIGYLPGSHTAVLLDFDRLTLWDIEEQRARLTHRMPSGKAATAAASAGSELLLGFRDGSIELRDINSWARLGHCQAFTNPVFSVRFSPRSRLAAALAPDLPGQTSMVGNLILWDVARGDELLSSISEVGAAATAVNFSHDEKSMAVACPDNSIALCDLAGRRVRHWLRGHTWDVVGLAFSPDDRILVSGSWDTTLRWWDVDKGKLLATSFVSGGSGLLNFSSDGRSLAVASMDSAIRLFHVPSQREMMSLPWQGSFAGEPVFSEDGSLLAVGSLAIKMPYLTARDSVCFWRAPVLK